MNVILQYVMHENVASFKNFPTILLNKTFSFILKRGSFIRLVKECTHELLVKSKSRITVEDVRHIFLRMSLIASFISCYFIFSLHIYIWEPE